MSDNSASTPPPPLWFTIVAGVAILWSLAGILACYSQLSMTAAQMADLPAAQRDAFTAMPAWVRSDYMMAVVAGLVGAVMLLLRRRLARAAFIVSLIGVFLQFGWVFGPYHGLDKLGPSAAAFPAFVALMCLAEIGVATVALRRGWLK